MKKTLLAVALAIVAIAASARERLTVTVVETDATIVYKQVFNEDFVNDSTIIIDGVTYNTNDHVMYEVIQEGGTVKNTVWLIVSGDALAPHFIIDENLEGALNFRPHKNVYLEWDEDER